MTLRLRGLTLWLALLLPAGLTVYGMIHNRLFAQSLWTPDGLHRFLIFAGGYLAVVLAFHFLRPAWFAPFVWIGTLGYTAAAIGLVPIFSAGLFLLACMVLGQSILGEKDQPPVPAMLLGLCLYMFAASLAALLPVNYPLVYLAALLVPLARNYRLTMHWLVRTIGMFRPSAPGRPSAQLGFGALVFSLLAQWLVMLEPEAGTDALAMHLVVPSNMATLHRWAFDVIDHSWAVMPMGADWCFSIVYLLGGEMAARLLNFAFLLAIVVVLVSIMRRWLPAGTAYLLAALFAATPLVQLLTGSLFVENLWALLALGAVTALAGSIEQKDPRLLVLAFVLVGGATATKFGALALAAPMLAALLWTVWRSGGRRNAWMTAGAAFACFLLFAAPPYLTAYAKTGNPVFPFLNGIFRSPYFGTKTSFANVFYRTPLSLRTPYDITFHTVHFLEGQDGAAGFQYLLLLPLAFFAIRRGCHRLAIVAALVLPPFFVLVYLTQSNLRYLYAAMPLAMIVIAGGLAGLRESNAGLYRTVCTLSVPVLLFNLYFLPSSGWLHNDFQADPMTAAGRAGYLEAHAPVRRLIDYLNAQHPGAPVALIGTTDMAGLRGRAFADNWHTDDFNVRLRTARSEQDIQRLLHEHGIEELVVPREEILIYWLHEFVKSCTETELAGAPYYIARIPPGKTCEHPPAITTPAIAGRYDSRDPHVIYTGPWIRGRFKEASAGFVSYTDVPGAGFRFNFEGTAVTYTYTRAFNRGIAEILLDGAKRTELDLYAPDIKWQTATDFVATGQGAHTLEVRITGRNSPAATGGFVDLDALAVR
jgi:hypothetical protein